MDAKMTDHQNCRRKIQCYQRLHCNNVCSVCCWYFL